jgi:hypothetical protein
MHIAKVNRDVAYVVIVVHVCCKLLFSMFHLFFSDICCKCVYLDVAYVSKHMFASVSDACFKYFI